MLWLRIACWYGRTYLNHPCILLSCLPQAWASACPGTERRLCQAAAQTLVLYSTSGHLQVYVFCVALINNTLDRRCLLRQSSCNASLFKRTPIIRTKALLLQSYRDVIHAMRPGHAGCSCNGHSTCSVEGVCDSCQGNTVGQSCGVCLVVWSALANGLM